MLAVKTQTLILPITLDSPYKLFGRLRVVFHPPVSFESYYGQKVTSAELEKISEQIMKSIYNDMKYYGQLLDK
jgi:1-acyl-sn-glycerol-3-phosphate acyltransferase